MARTSQDWWKIIQHQFAAIDGGGTGIGVGAAEGFGAAAGQYQVDGVIGAVGDDAGERTTVAGVTQGERGGRANGRISDYSTPEPLKAASHRK